MQAYGILFCSLDTASMVWHLFPNTGLLCSYYSFDIASMVWHLFPDTGLLCSFYSLNSRSMVWLLFSDIGLLRSFYTSDSANIIWCLIPNTGLSNPFCSLDTGTDKSLLTTTRLLRIIQDKFYFVLLSHLTLRLNVLFLIELRHDFGWQKWQENIF